MKKALASASLLLGVLTAAPAAHAQCPPGSWLCADIRVGGGLIAQPPPPPVVYVQPVMPPPPPRVVYVQPPPPPPRIVYVQPPPVVVYQPAPPPTYVVPAATQYMPIQQRSTLVGLQAHAGFTMLPSLSGAGAIGLGGAGLRIRGRNQFWGFELAVSAAGGRDYNGDARIEVPTTGSMLFYFNPQHRFQVYGLLGAQLSFGAVDYTALNAVAHGQPWGQYVHVGGHAGLGFEYQASARVSLFVDARGFLRTRIDDEADRNPEFARTLPTGTTQTTNTSMGLSTQVGVVLYF